ncbi:hypothetical protein SKAU_G00028780 [Synaphobranchus kaupii]|uniref:Uncharacterized protein n=1 Tax=Synaphobranchus kaupii TaxID=118154 RepID=A0A9Q1GDC8_SYNKA|nr:hypothetical protein SKAU_G00028780 [Synaphobranchus kaupii]
MRHQHYAHTPLPVELSSDSGRMVTEYQARFFAHSSMTVRKNYRRLGGTMGNVTVFRSDFVPHDVTMRVPKVTKAHHVPPEGSVTQTSTYVHDYKAYSIQQNSVPKAIEYSPPSTKMVVRSTYKEEFQLWDTPLQRPVRTNSNLNLSHIMFDTPVPFQDRCCHTAPAAAGKSRIATPAGEEAQPFESTTTYKVQFVCLPAQPKQLTQRLVYKPSSSPLSCVTTYRHDYRCLQVDVAEPIRSKATWESTPTRCQGRTKLSDKYKTWPLRPKDEVELIATSHADYVGWQCQCSATPKQAWTTDKVSLEALSTMDKDRRTWEAEKCLPITQVKVPDRLVGTSKNTTTCSSRDVPKTLPLTHSFQSRHRCIAMEIQPCSERAYRDTRADGNKLQCTRSAREGSAARPVQTNSNKPKSSHSSKTRGKRSN